MTKKTVEKHEEGFIHISKRGLGRFFLFLLSLAAVVGHTALINAIYKGIVGDGGFKAHQLVIIYPCILHIGLIGLITWTLLAWVNQGYDNLDSDEFVGIAIGTFIGFVFCIMIVPIIIIESSFIGGIIAGTIFMAVAQFVAGLTYDSL